MNVEVFLKDETVWLTQKEISRLFGKSKATISEHLKKIYAEGELQMDSTVRKFRTVEMENWVQFLHTFLELSNYPILEDKGKVSAIEAKLKAEQEEYDSYRRQQDREFISDFGRESNGFMASTSKRVTMSKTNRKRQNSSIDYC